MGAFADTTREVGKGLGDATSNLINATAQAREMRRQYKASLSANERKLYDQFQHKKLVRIYTCKECGRVWLITFKQMWGQMGIHWLWIFPCLLTLIGAIPSVIFIVKRGKKGRMAYENICLKCQGGVTYDYISKEKAKEIKKLIKQGKPDQLSLLKGKI